MALSIDGTGNGTIGNLSVTTETGNILSTASTVAPKVPAFRARQLDAVNQGINASTDTKVLFAQEDFDTANFYDPSTSRFQPTIAGYYWISSSVRTGNTGGQHCRFDTCYYIDGSESLYGMGMGNDGNRDLQTFASSIIYLDGTQYVEVYVNQNSTTNVTITCGNNAGSAGDGGIVYFTGYLVHAT